MPEVAIDSNRYVEPYGRIRVEIVDNGQSVRLSEDTRYDWGFLYLTKGSGQDGCAERTAISSKLWRNVGNRKNL